QLWGGRGSDVVNGGDGDDIISGDRDAIGPDGPDGVGAADYLTGGAGSDQFDYEEIADSPAVAGQHDIIYDFEVGIDLIFLCGIDANVNLAGTQSFTFIGLGTASNAGDLAISISGTDTWVHAEVDGDGIADFAIQLKGIHLLTVDDFWL